jgi:D-alanyl-D-alanine-carboxypeptidase/D-alanyl-D-alanine-endopeptidase
MSYRLRRLARGLVAQCRAAARIASLTIVIATILVALACYPLRAIAQDKPDVAGDYSGEIAGQEVGLHLKIEADGSLGGALDHLDPKAPWMFVLADLHLAGRTLSFAIPSANATWKGEIAKDGSLSGSWNQKSGSWLVDFTRLKVVPAARPSPVDGIWLGELSIWNKSSTRVQIVVKSDIGGREYCTLDALDTYDMGLQCVNVALVGADFSFDVPAAGMHWTGKLAADGNALSGSTHAKLLKDGTTQDVPQELNFTRQTALTPEKVRPVATYDSAMPPVTAAELESVLDRDLAEALKSGELAPSTGAGVSIAVYEHGNRRVFSYGAAKPDSIYEIGSITKTFTGLMLAQMAVQGKVKLDEPVRELLPAGTVAKPQGAEITLLDLATQRSGLPAMPDNISLANIDQPYADYHAADLMAYMSKHGVANPARASSSFGALGFGLLGVALADREGSSYDALLKEEIAESLGLKDTTVALSAEQQSRMIAGHDQFHSAAKAWDADALAGAISIRSTAPDMLAYLEACLHPERVKPVAGSQGGAKITAALRLALQSQGELTQGMRIALGWLYQPETGNYWHNGATAAYSSYAFFNPAGDYAAVVLLNGSPGVHGSFVELLGRHISQRLAGKPAISLGKME